MKNLKITDDIKKRHDEKTLQLMKDFLEKLQGKTFKEITRIVCDIQNIAELNTKL